MTSANNSNHPKVTYLKVLKEEFEKLLTDRIEEGEELFKTPVKTEQEFQKNQKKFSDWNDFNLELLKQSFSIEHNEYKKSYHDAGTFIGLERVFTGSTPLQKLQDFKDKVEAKVDNLKKLKTKLILLRSDEVEENKSLSRKETTSKRVFIIHGHDEKAKLDVARTVEKLGLEPIILHEQPNEGRTVIEKFERNADVGFAITILTCDDLGKTKTAKKDNYRARQNVIIEMGYFIGSLGRNRVFPLYEIGVELPSDLNGIVYTLLDDGGKWKFDLVKELKVAGYKVDANKIL